ncbi:ABC transporter substrate-binding protein [Pseudomonas knackmussii]|uniref:ABC transporter substrate-binding protein n=1 Tax=Pseudomonas knackmussii TaxID=65741 RepID=A0ABY4KSJ5_9PSED|nr:ABC transporter substrate-binding protein [Pseudomonas knackmussii]UPQ83851.1 ABC transporter substrate-binding protein [Pseudomonas knackmussii]
MYFRNKHRLALLAATIATWLSVTAGPVSANDKVFDVVAPFEIGGLDPAISGFVFQRMQITETLLESDAKGQPLPALAERWSVSDDGKEWRLTIRQGVKFHDGSALTAEVAARSLSAANTRTGMLRSAKIDAITADDNDVVIRLAEPFKPLTAVLAHSSANILATAAYDAEDNVQSVIGTGPYQLTLLEPPQRLAAERFEDYWGEKPSIKKTTYLGAGRGETRSLMAESNGAELVFQLDPPSIARLKRSKHVKVLMGPVPRVVVLAANAGGGATAPVEVRKAISLAIQREGIAAAVLRAPGTGATQMFANSVPAWHDERLPALAYDPDAARTLLDAQGWTPGADGIRQKDGERLSLKLLTYSDRPELPLIATALQAQLRDVGIDVEVSVANASAIPAAHNDGTLQLALYGRNYALVPDPLVTLLADFGNGGAEWGPLGWDNPQFERTMSTLLASDDAIEQQRLRNQIVALIQHDLPLIPIAWYRQSIAVSNAVDNAAIDPFERTFGLSTMRWAE